MKFNKILLTIILSNFLYGCGTAPVVLGTFNEDSVSTTVPNVKFGVEQTKEVGETIYENSYTKITKTKFATTLTPTKGSMGGFGLEITLPSGTESPLLTRSLGGEPTICTPYYGGTIACLVDLDKNGTFDKSMYSKRETYFDLEKPVNYRTSYAETKSKIEDNRKEFIYQGAAKGVLKFTYREFTSDNLARPAFTQDLTYETQADGTAIIGFKGMRIKILKATNLNVTYIIEQPMG